MTDDGLDWVRDAVFYEIFPDRYANGDPTNDPAGVEAWDATPTRDNFFGGDLAGVLERLPYIADLGVTAIYFTPIFLAGTNHRYDTQDYRQIDPAVGDEELLRTVVEHAHEVGIRVVLDGVFNHVGDGFWAFRDVVAHGQDSPYWRWFEARGFPIISDPPNYQTCGGTSYLPKLNTAEPAVRRYLLDVATHWIRVADIDGWRLDVPWKVDPGFWPELRQAVKSTKRNSYLVGEIWHSWDGWFERFDGLMNYQLKSRLIDFCVLDAMDAEDLAIETEALLKRTPDPTLMLNLLGSHDTERLMTVAQGDARRVSLALAAMFTFPGAPMIYYGDEVGLEGGNDPDCRRTMPWESGRWNREIHESVRRLSRLRRDHPALRRGSWELVATFNRMIAFVRRSIDDTVVVVLNAGVEQRDVALDLANLETEHWRVVDGDPLEQRDGQIRLPTVPERSAVVLERMDFGIGHRQPEAQAPDVS